MPPLLILKFFFDSGPLRGYNVADFSSCTGLLSFPAFEDSNLVPSLVVKESGLSGLQWCAAPEVCAGRFLPARRADKQARE
jgi:hypothetical protein